MRIPKPEKSETGKREREWKRERFKLKKIYWDKGITICEVKLDGCMPNFGLSFAHLHKRFWYYDKPGLLGDFNQTLLACAYCHPRIERDKKLTAKIFKRLRP